MKHTPGPWEIGEGGDIFIPGACIATVCGAPEGIEEAEANARLIAAAPDLLKTLDEIQDIANEFEATLPGGNSPWIELIYNTAQAAIKKAL